MNSFGLAPATIEALKNCFSQETKIEKVMLYGSRAKGNFNSGSDIDLTIFAATMTLSELLALENKLDNLLLPYKIDLSLFHQIENVALIDHIQRVGQIFYSREQ